MAVIGFREQWDGRDGDEDENGVRNYTRIWLVETDNAHDTAAMIKAYVLTPSKWSQHPADTYATARSINVDNLSESPNFWKMVVKYSTSTRGANANELDLQSQQVHPLDRQATIKWGFAQFQRAVITAADGKIMVNSARDVYENITRDDSRPVVTITKNMIGPPLWLLDYQDAVNSDTFSVDGIVVEPKEAKIQSVEVSERIRDAYVSGATTLVTYRKVSITMHLRRNNTDVLLKGWDLGVLDEGLRELKQELNADGTAFTGAMVWRNIIIDGHVTSKPQLLNHAGGVQPADQWQNPRYNYFELYKKLPFSALPLA